MGWLDKLGGLFDPSATLRFSVVMAVLSVTVGALQVRGW